MVHLAVSLVTELELLHYWSLNYYKSQAGVMQIYYKRLHVNIINCLRIGVLCMFHIWREGLDFRSLLAYIEGLV